MIPTLITPIASSEQTQREATLDNWLPAIRY